MKTTLTKEQSQHLIDLGIPKAKASDIEEHSDPISQWTHRGAPIFKLEDFLNGEILPKEIKTEDNVYWQTILWTGTSYFVGYRNHNTDEWLHQICFQEELIDALYKLTVWCAENKHIELCQKKV